MATTEPVVAGITAPAVVNAGIGIAGAFGVHFTPAQLGSIEGGVIALLGVVAFLVRQHVVPVAKLPADVQAKLTNPFLTHQ